MNATVWILEIDTATYAFFDKENAIHMAAQIQVNDYNLYEVQLYDADVQTDNEGQFIIYTGIYQKKERLMHSLYRFFLELQDSNALSLRDAVARKFLSMNEAQKENLLRSAQDTVAILERLIVLGE